MKYSTEVTNYSQFLNLEEGKPELHLLNLKEISICGEMNVENKRNSQITKTLKNIKQQKILKNGEKSYKMVLRSSKLKKPIKKSKKKFRKSKGLISKIINFNNRNKKKNKFIEKNKCIFEFTIKKLQNTFLKGNNKKLCIPTKYSYQNMIHQTKEIIKGSKHYFNKKLKLKNRFLSVKDRIKLCQLKKTCLNTEINNVDCCLKKSKKHTNKCIESKTVKEHPLNIQLKLDYEDSKAKVDKNVISNIYRNRINFSITSNFNLLDQDHFYFNEFSEDISENRYNPLIRFNLKREFNPLHYDFDFTAI